MKDRQGVKQKTWRQNLPDTTFITIRLKFTEMLVYLSSRRKILPTLLFGNSSLNSTSFGTL